MAEVQSGPPALGPRKGSPATGWEALIPLDWNRLGELSNEPVPTHLKRWWFALGGTPAYLFLIQITTGVLLLFYYQPSASQAYESVQRITHDIPFGWFIRSIHKWSANLMIVTVLLHMLRVFFTGAYRHPRTLNWVFGVALLGLTLTFGFTGYSLVYEQLSFWGATVAANLTESIPLVGHWAATFLRGGPEVNDLTLTRLYVLHVGILPAATIAVLGLHITMIRLHGVTEYQFEPEVGVAPDWRQPAVLLPIVAAGGALLAAFVAITDWVRFEFIGYSLTPGGSRLAWGMIALLLGYTTCALFRWKITGLMLFIAASVLSLGKLTRDLLLGETMYPDMWLTGVVVIAVLLIIALVRHRLFAEPPDPHEPAHYNFFPDHAMTELMVGTGLLLLLTLLTLVFPVELAAKANPHVTPEHIKPEWYFFAQFRLLKLSPGVAGLTALQVSVVLTGVAMLALVAWPWVDAVFERILPGRDFSVYVGIVVFLTVLGLTVWEAMLP